MDFALIGFCGTLFALFTIINNMMGGYLIASGDVSNFQSIVMFNNLEIGGFAVPLPSINYLNGLMVKGL